MASAISNSKPSTVNTQPVKSAPKPAAAKTQVKTGPTDTGVNSAKVGEADSTVGVNMSSWLEGPEKTSAIGADGTFTDPGSLTNDQIKAEFEGKSVPELQQIMEGAFRKADEHEATMGKLDFETGNVSGLLGQLDLKPEQIKELGQAQFYGIAESYFGQMAKAQGQDPAGAPQAEAISAYMAENMPKGSDQRANFINDVMGWASDPMNSVHAQRGRAIGADNWAMQHATNLMNGSTPPNAQTMQTLLGVKQQAGAVIGQTRVATQLNEFALAKEQ